jgi:hypothetical protein
LGHLLRRGLDLGILIDGIELASADGVREHFGGLLDALEKLIALIITSSSLLVGVVLQDFPAVGFLDLVLGGTVSQTGYAENSVVILRLH